MRPKTPKRQARPEADPGEPEKIQKVLARGGLGSRRQIEAWIREGRIQVNGRTAELGQRIDQLAEVRLNGRPISFKRLQPPPVEVLIYNKPEGEVVTRRDESGRSTVFQQLERPSKGRWVSVGRLDINTSGLLILTNHGELANRLMHPSAEIEREYAVRIQGELTPQQLTQLTQGVELEDGPAQFERIKLEGGEGSNRWYRVVLKEGRNREVRRLFEALELRVARLIRVRYAQIELPRNLRQGQSRPLSPRQIQQLFKAAGLPWEEAPQAGTLGAKPSPRPRGAGKRRLPARGRR